MTSGDLELWYGTLQIGVIKDAFYNDFNWYGTLEIGVNPGT
jgi:hypothetical protein